jgi:hypothetical protein
MTHIPIPSSPDSRHAPRRQSASPKTPSTREQRVGRKLDERLGSKNATPAAAVIDEDDDDDDDDDEEGISSSVRKHPSQCPHGKAVADEPVSTAAVCLWGGLPTHTSR